MQFAHARHPDPQWRARVEAIAPRNPRVAWLHVVWLPGEVYAPIQRWGIYEMHPNLDVVGPELVAEFHRPPPRDRGQWVPAPGVPGGKRWHSESLVSRLQYDLFQQFHCWPQLTWIVQGDRGGHEWALTQPEEAVYRLRTGMDHWPVPGELPYAPLDQRVVDALQRRDKLRRWEAQMGEWEKRFADGGAPALADAAFWAGRDLDEERIELNHAVMKWLDEQFYGVKDMMTNSMAAAMLEDAPVGDPPMDEDHLRKGILSLR